MLSCYSSARRAAKEAKEAPAQPAPEKVRVDIKKFVKIGRPGYKVTKQRDPENGQQSLLFQVSWPTCLTIMGRIRLCVCEKTNWYAVIIYLCFVLD